MRISRAGSAVVGLVKIVTYDRTEIQVLTRCGQGIFQASLAVADPTVIVDVSPE
jgi:hypothetical protein